MKKLRMSLPNLRKIFNIVKFRRAYTLERDHYFIQTKEDLLIITKKTSDPDHNYIDEKSANGERVYNLIKTEMFSKSRSHFNCNFQCPLNFLKNTFYLNERNYRKPAIKLTAMLSHLLCT